jgi:SAM-dependent methyltransferase
MKSYEYLSSIYDQFMDDYDYQQILDRLEPFLKESGAHVILDLACGTGTGSVELYKRGYNVTGIDLSEEMLIRAHEKSLEAHAKIKYLQADMRDFQVKTRFDAVISLTDGFNYLLTEEDIRKALGNIAGHLRPEGVLIFDMSTEYKFSEIIGHATFAETDDSAAYIWENYYDEEQRLLTFDLTIFEKHLEEDCYSRHFESHVQKAYSPETMKRLLDDEGYELISCFGTEKELEKSDRVFYIAKRV